MQIFSVGRLVISRNLHNSSFTALRNGDYDDFFLGGFFRAGVRVSARASTSWLPTMSSTSQNLHRIFIIQLHRFFICEVQGFAVCLHCSENKTARKRQNKMTRKHFELIAYHISNLQYDGFTPDQIEKVAREIANACAVSNSRFNRTKFVEACTK